MVWRATFFSSHVAQSFISNSESRRAYWSPWALFFQCWGTISGLIVSPFLRASISFGAALRGFGFCSAFAQSLPFIYSPFLRASESFGAIAAFSQSTFLAGTTHEPSCP